MQVCELTTLEARELTECETVIERNLESFHEVGAALLKIRDAKLYRQSHKTFADYCEDKWAIAKATAYQFMDAAKVSENVRHGGQTPPSTERQARPLAKIKEPEEQRAAWQEAVATAPEGKITAKHVEEVVQRRTSRIQNEEIKEQRIKGQTFEFEEEAACAAEDTLAKVRRAGRECGFSKEMAKRIVTACREIVQTVREEMQ